MSMIDDILREAEAELELDKTANDQNGAPETANVGGGQQDIAAQANAFLQELEQFKTQLGTIAADQTSTDGQDPNADPNAMQEPNPDADPNAQVQPAGGATIQTPGGTIIKLASLVKLAFERTRMNYSEVE